MFYINKMRGVTESPYGNVSFKFHLGMSKVNDTINQSAQKNYFSFLSSAKPISFLQVIILKIIEYMNFKKYQKMIFMLRKENYKLLLPVQYTVNRNTVFLRLMSKNKKG